MSPFSAYCCAGIHLAWSCDCLECAAWEAHLSWGIDLHVQQSFLVMQSEHDVMHHAGDAWHLRVTVSGLVNVLTAADILQPQLLQGTDTIRSTMRGRLTAATFPIVSCLRMVRLTAVLYC